MESHRPERLEYEASMFGLVHELELASPQLGEMLELGLIHNKRDSCGSHTEKSKP